MATIEERAKKHFPDILDDDCTIPTPAEYIIEEKRQIYILGATEQKAIDIDKAKEAFNKTCGWLSTYPSCESWYNELFENFMKNMEGQL